MKLVLKHISAMSVVCLAVSLAEQLPMQGQSATAVALSGLLINMTIFASAVRRLIQQQS